MEYDKRPDPDELLSKIQKKEPQRGNLKIFFGMSAGVGKTYSMLKEARILIERGEDVVIGWMESHGRKETDKLVSDIEVIPRKSIEYRGIKLEDMDLEALLVRKPSVALIDELAHTNAPGLKHPKRYQDILELLEAGIDVYTTVNIQHLESIADVVEEVSHIRVKERIPDSIFDQANDVQLVDVPPEELIQRLNEGKVYTGDKSKDALLHFFKKENLAMLREISLRHAAELASHQLTNILRGESYSLFKGDNQRILVAISSSPNSEYLIRWGRRLAYNLKTNWICIYVETAFSLSEYDKDCLTKNMTLARNLGASVVTLPDENVANAIICYAEQNNISIIIIGKSALSKKRKLFENVSLSERIIRESGKISVIAVQEKDIPQDYLKWAKRKIESSSLWQYIFAFAIALIVTVINYFVTILIGHWSSSIIYLATISILALVLDRKPVLMVACISALAWDFLFIPPKYTFAIHKIEDILMLLLYFIVAITSGWLTSRFRANEKMLRIREQRMSILNDLSSALETASGAENAVTCGIEYISKAFKCETIVFFKQDDNNELSESPVKNTSFKSNEKELSAARFCFSEGQSTGRFTSTLPVVSYHYVPMAAPGGTIGVIGIKFENERSWTNDEESFLLTLGSTISLAADREFLAEKNRKNMLVQESERLSRILLHSISHELRTPLSVIQGSASALLDPDTASDKYVRDQLIEEIISGSEKLNNIVENLLSMSRLEAGGVKLKIEESDPEEIVSIAIKQAGKELKKRPVHFIKPENLPLLPCDFILIIQVLTNIIQNAAQYASEAVPIEIKIEVIENFMKFSILDSGPGVEEEAIIHLFEKFYRGKNAKKGGLGLGLSICKGIIEAHLGTIHARNRQTNGLIIEFVLPLKLQNTQG